MSAEQEAKFQVHDCRIVEYCLRTVGQLHTPWHFERNALYDRGQELRSRKHILRLRITDSAILTFKEPMPGPGVPGVKAMREIECQIHDPGTCILFYAVWALSAMCGTKNSALSGIWMRPGFI